MKRGKLISLLSFFPLGIILSWCGNKYALDLSSPDFSWSPKFIVEMQNVGGIPWTQDSIYQEVSDKDESLDTLVIAWDHTEESSLAGYVQNAINQLKIQWYKLSGERTNKINIKKNTGSIPGLLKTYQLEGDTVSLHVAQLFFEKEDEVVMISYASDSNDNVKVFTKELSSLKLSF